jgi:hypothetical protein
LSEETCSYEDEDDNDDEEEDEDRVKSKPTKRRKGMEKTLCSLEEMKSGHAKVPALDKTPTRASLEEIIRAFVTHAYSMTFSLFKPFNIY